MKKGVIKNKTMNELLQNNKDFSEGLLQYLNDSPSAYHAVENAATLLKKNHFQELKDTEPWSLKTGGKYYTTKNGSCLIAFTIGSASPDQSGFRIIGAHTDSPAFKIKSGPCTVTNDGYVKVNIEPYGGAILSTWFDRPLAIAGKVILKNGNSLEEKLVKIDKPVLILPNLCIHLQRDINEGHSYNKQTEMLPLLGMKQEGVDINYLTNLLAGEIHVNKEAILDYELYLYEYQKGLFTGEHSEFISASRIDDLAMVYAGLRGLIASNSDANKLLVAFDNEEVGSVSAQGANSLLLTHTLNRICKNLNLNDDAYFQAIAKSISISADAAHAVHPNYSEKHDPENRPVLGGGPVIKYSASQRYGTTAFCASYFMEACSRAGVPYQKFFNRNDILGGSTIGPTLSAHTTIPTVDMGTALLAMHSIREFGSVADIIYTMKAFQSFYDR